MKKKLLPILIALLLGLLMLPAAAADPITVYVTVTDNGSLAVTERGEVLTAVPVQVPRNATVNDALVALHGAYCPAGESGYKADAMSSYGIDTWFISKWFGQTLDFSDGGKAAAAWRNHSMSSTLNTTLREGDVVDVCLYTIQSSASYSYSYYGLSWMDYYAVDVAVGESFSLGVWKSSMDMMTYQYTDAPAAGLTVFVNGAQTNQRVGADGQLTLSFDAPGAYYVSAGGDPASGTAALRVNVTEGGQFQGHTILPPGRLAASAGLTEGEPITVFVTVTELDGFGLDDEGQRLSAVPVTVYNGATLDDVLDALHREHCGQGAEGYASGSMEMYGAESYYIRSWFGRNVDGSTGAATLAAAWAGHDLSSTLATPVQDGDPVNVVLYALGESSGFGFGSYRYYGLSYFDHTQAEAGVGETVTLHAYTEVSDPYGGPARTAPLGELQVLVNGEAADLRTDAAGALSIAFDALGVYDILAVGSDAAAPAAMRLTVREGGAFDPGAASVSESDVLAGNLSAPGHGTGDPVTVYVTVTDKGQAVQSQLTGETLIAVPVTVPGGSTVDDVLQAFHGLHSSAGAMGYSSSKMDMWGSTMYSIGNWFGKASVAADGSDYAVIAWRNRNTMSTLAEKVAEGDLIDVNIYGVKSAMSMDYRYWGLGYFDYGRVSAGVGETITLHAAHDSMDAATYSWSSYVSPNLTVYVNGEKRSETVDGNGELKLSFDQPGEYLVLAQPGDESYGAAAVRITIEAGASFADAKPDTAVDHAKAPITKADYAGLWKLLLIAAAVVVVLVAVVKAVKKGKGEKHDG